MGQEPWADSARCTYRIFRRASRGRFGFLATFRLFALHVALLGLMLPGVAESASDWPMWRFDASRSGVSADELPAELSVQWTRELGQPRPAWPTEQDYQGKLQYDQSFEPIVVSGRIIVPSMVSDSVTAYDTNTGGELWRFYADGPVRFAPAAADGRVYFVSDDGHLYCLNVADGKLIWKVRGGPAARAVLGNERLISTWPARGAPVIDNGHVYFAAGIWPFMGTFVHAVDATTGAIVWTNSGTGSVYNLHQHGGAEAFGGVAPQGYFAATEDRLLVAGGLTVPAVFDRGTGEVLHFEQSHAAVGKGSGGYDVAAKGSWYFNRGKMFDMTNGKPLLSLATPLIGEQEVTGLHDGAVVRFASELQSKEVIVTDRRGQKTRESRRSLKELERARSPVALERLYLQAGSRLFGTTADGELVSLAWPKEGSAELRVVWRAKSPGKVFSMVAADNRLFVVTQEGMLYCFGPDGVEAKHHVLPAGTQSERSGTEEAQPSASADNWPAVAKATLESSGQTAGYALVWGIESGRLVEELLKQSDMYVIAVDADPQRVARLRRHLDDARCYGQRAHVLCAEPDQFPFPPYLANLVVSERAAGSGWNEHLAPKSADQFFRSLFRALRPYGGVACWSLPTGQRAAFLDRANSADLVNGRAEQLGELVTLTRVGALSGAGQWTHQYYNSGNTVFSADQRVKLPLGLLWFGGPSNHVALPRHGQGPIPQVAGGRLLIEGVDWLTARCVYTGRTLWQREFPDIGFPYKSNNHTFTELVYINNQPGANYIGSNYVTLADGVYVLYRNECHRLAPDTGETVKTFRLPKSEGAEEPDAWGFMTIWGDYLVAAASPQTFDDRRLGEQNWNSTSSRRLVVMNRHTGKVLWTRDAVSGFRHNAIIPVADKLFVIDRLSEGALKLLARRGVTPNDHARLLALDLRTGEDLWETDDSVFGTWLSYSAEHDVLIQAGRTGGRASLVDEPSNRIIALRGSDGKALWDRNIRYTGPLLLAGDQIISSGRGDGSISLLTGEDRQRVHPITGQPVKWTHSRTYGCGTMLGCQNLLTFRSGAAGYFDMANDGGTGNFGGFKAGCTPNLIPADGVLNAPDYTRTCSCSYQNQTSLALVHERDFLGTEIEQWTHSTLPAPKRDESVQRIGLNFGAPGDRLDDHGTMWLDFPSVGGKSPDIPVRVSGGNVQRWFRDHTAYVNSSNSDLSLPWVAASGLEGAVSMRLTLQSGSLPPAKLYTIRLHFAEPEQLAKGERVFDVYLQQQKVLESLDVVKESGGVRVPLVREIPGVKVEGELHIELRPASDNVQPPVLSGIEITSE